MGLRHQGGAGWGPRFVAGVGVCCVGPGTAFGGRTGVRGQAKRFRTNLCKATFRFGFCLHGRHVDHQEGSERLAPCRPEGPEKSCLCFWPGRPGGERALEAQRPGLALPHGWSRFGPAQPLQQRRATPALSTPELPLPLMGWTAAGETLKQTNFYLSFPGKEGGRNGVPSPAARQSCPRQRDPPQPAKPKRPKDRSGPLL